MGHIDQISLMWYGHVERAGKDMWINKFSELGSIGRE